MAQPHTFPTGYPGRQTVAANGSIFEFKPVHGWTHIGGPPLDEWEIGTTSVTDVENAPFTSTESGLDSTTIGDAINENRRELEAQINQDVYDDSAEDNDGVYTYQAFHRVVDDSWVSFRCNLNTGGAAGEATGTGPIPADLTILTYV